MASSGITAAHQVGGHPGITTTEDGSLLMKPTQPLELDFYQTTLTDPALEELRVYTPKFYGSLKLEGKVDENNPGDDIRLVPVEGIKEGAIESIVLENVSHSFLKPNILDIKLGKVLYDAGTSPEKRERMEKKALETTSAETGLRLVGFQVHDNMSSQPVITPREYGRTLKVSDLPDSIARFFPIAPTTKLGTTSERESTGLPKESLLTILQLIREDIADIHEILSRVDMRMVGTSVLIAYEADQARAEEGLAKILSEESVEEEEDDSDDDSDNGSKPLGPPCAVKLIDFAHTRLVPGEGPDEGVLFGLETFLKLLDGRIEQVSAELEVVS